MGENNVKEIKCESVKDFIQRISYGGDLYNLITGNYIYRGESSDKYDLIPSALRSENHEKLVNSVKTLFPSYNYENENSEHFQMIAEYIHLHVFYLFCDYRGLRIPNIDDFRNKLISQVDPNRMTEFNYTWLPSKYIEIAGLAQHYGIYTRLLDWSRDINVAIYFAISGLMKIEESKMPKNIVLWVLDTITLNVAEKDRPGVILYTPEYAGNPNLCAQKGVFSLYSIANYSRGYSEGPFKENDKIVKPFDEIIKEQVNDDNKEPILYKILIPTPQDNELYNYLRNEGYDASLIFPGYDGVTKKIKEDLYWKNLKQKNEQESK